MLCYNYLKSMTDGCTSDTKKPNLYHRKFGRFEVAVQPTLGKGTSNLERHSSSKIHREAVLHWEVAKHGSVPVMAPAQEEFQETLVKFRRGDSARSQGSGGASDKVVFMRWCLSEALLDRYRTALRNAWTIVLVRDERRGKLLIRFRATLKDMSVVCGVLGMVKLIDGSRAKDILNATTKILSVFATPRYEAPHMFRGGTRECDSHLKKHLQESVEMIVSDSAASEILAQQLGMGLRGSHETVFPNAKIIGRDRAHACQRLVKHPWKAESSVNSWMEDCLAFFGFSWQNGNCKVSHWNIATDGSLAGDGAWKQFSLPKDLEQQNLQCLVCRGCCYQFLSPWTGSCSCKTSILLVEQTIG